MSRTVIAAGAVFGVGLVTALGAFGCSSSSSGNGASGSSSSGSSGSSGSSSGASDSGSDAALGPGAAYQCTSSGKDAWETYGASAFVAVNKSIFANVNAEIGDAGTANLGTSFTEIGTGTPAAASDPIATFEGKLAAFLVYAYGGPTSITYTDGVTYSGLQDMTTAHTGFNITSDQYNYFVTNIIVPALASNGVPTGDIQSCFAPVITGSTATAFIASIVGH